MTDVKRLNYFTSQFLVEKDFKDEQAYLVDMRRRHNLLLHTWGVAGDGLQASKAGDKIVTVGIGMAVDKDGREMVLLDAQSKDLSAFGSNVDVYLTLKYQEVSDPADHYASGGVDNYTRITERPLLEASTTVPVTDGSVIVLAKVRMDKDGNVGKVDNVVRRLVGSAIDPASEIVVRALSVMGSADVGGDLGIGTTSPGAGLEIQKGATNDLALLLNSSGSGWGSGVQLRNTAKGGKTFGIYSGSGNLHVVDVDANTDRLVVDQNGKVGIGTESPSEMLTVDPQGTGGIVIGNPSTKNGGYTSLIMNITAQKDGSAAIQSIKSSGKAYGVLALNPDGGSVGIGTATPAVALDVQGYIKQNAQYMSGGGGANASWSSLSFNAYHNATNDDWVFPDPSRVAMTVEMDGNPKSGRFQIFTTTATNKTGWILRFGIDANTGEVSIPGHLTVGGGKNAYVVDRFINAAGDTLEQGDVLVLGENQASVHYGLNNAIPVPEVDVTVKAYDTRVCGIVCEVHVEPEPGTMEGAQTYPESRQSSRAERNTEGTSAETSNPQTLKGEKFKGHDRTKVEQSQSGRMVTLGAFAYCKVDADIAPINVGDLLTTSPSKGHAQKVLDPSKATGAIIGKALGALSKGKGKIPVLVSLH